MGDEHVIMIMKTFLKSVIGLALGAVILPSVAVAQPSPQPGMTDLAVQSMTAHQRDIAQRALTDDPQAQSDIGIMFYTGDGLPKNDLQALTWFKMAAEHGNPAGQYNLGMMYLKGIGVERSEDDAVKWLTSAAMKGQSEAQFMLGVLATEGTKSQAPDEIRSVAWMKLAAANGSSAAEAIYALMDEQISEETRQSADGVAHSLMAEIATGLQAPQPIKVEIKP